MDRVDAFPKTTPHQTLIGLSLAGAVMTGWAVLHVYGVYFHRWSLLGVVATPVIVAVQTWLSVGLFIVAHDAMHGSLAPGRPRLNAAMGTTALGLYAGFRFGRLRTAHHQHHRAPGTAEDPDYFADDPSGFRGWFLNFFRTYFGWREFAVLTLALTAAIVVFHAGIANLLIFWAAPALLSAVQLFVFGTWLPHRAGAPFADGHNSRSSGFGSLMSLLTCFHFGRHHEHHLQPWLPWWRLDAASKTAARNAARPYPPAEPQNP